MADLSIENLTVRFATPFGLLTALTDVSLTLKAGAALGLVGETGSGKTSLARALLGLHPRPSVSGKIQFGELALTNLPEGAWQTLRWKRIALGVQNAGTAFDPVYTIEAQILETMQAHLASAVRRWQTVWKLWRSSAACKRAICALTRTN